MRSVFGMLCGVALVACNGGGPVTPAASTTGNIGGTAAGSLKPTMFELSEGGA
jgi:hypothetical protein